MKNRLLLIGLVLAIATGIGVGTVSAPKIVRAQQATSTIGNLPSNSSPPPYYFTITDCGNAGQQCTYKSTLQQVVNAVISFPISKANGGTGTSSPNPTSTGCGTLTGSWPNNVYDTTACNDPAAINISVGSNITGGGPGPTPSAIALASPVATPPTTCAGWNAVFQLTSSTCPPSPYPTPTITSGNANCTTAGLVFTCTAPAPGLAMIFQTVRTVFPNATLSPGFQTFAMPLNQGGNGTYKLVGYAISCYNGGVVPTGTAALSVTLNETYGATAPVIPATTGTPYVTVTSYACPTGNVLSCSTTVPATNLPTPTSTPTGGEQIWLWATLVAGQGLSGPCSVDWQIEQT